MYLLRQAVHNASSSQNPCSIQPLARSHCDTRTEIAPPTNIGTKSHVAGDGHHVGFATSDDQRASFLAVSDTTTIPVHRTVTIHPSTSSVNAPISASKLAQITRDTRARAKAVSITIHDGLTGSRAALIDDAGPTIPQIPTDTFFEHVFPRPEIIDYLDDIVTDLSKGRWGAYSRPMRRWRAFPKDPKTAGKIENVVFGSLITIAGAVSNAARAYDKGKIPLTRFDQDPSRAPASDWRTSDSKPDAYFILCQPNAGDEPHWMDIAATGEYKRSDGEIRYLEDDSKKVLWNMHQTLRDDPCRRWAYGFTIENRTMRLWYASRAEIFVAAPFDFMESPAYLVRFFLALFYSDLPELGWDPTMEYHPAVGSLAPYYIITVRIKDRDDKFQDAQFKTLDLLSNVGAEGLRGRGTRVWEVRQWVNGAETGEKMVLKDCWIDSDRTREGDIMAQIVEEADASEAATATADGMDDTMTAEKSTNANSLTPEQRLKDALLTPFIHGDVHNGDVVDRTFSEEERDKIQDPDGWFVFHRTQSKLDKFEKLSRTVGKKRGPKGDHRTLWDAMKHEIELKPITYHPKTHYRIVFHEVCKVLHQEQSLNTIFYVLVQVCLILQALHWLGWVHRDLSAGNIMFVVSSKQVKLADFEYAKKIGSSKGTCHEIRTGTVDFMSIEVNDMMYYFEPPGATDKGWILRQSLRPEEYTYDGYTRPQGLGRQETESQTRSWCYNPLHDLESVVWLFFYFTLFRDIFIASNTPRLPQKAENALLITASEEDAHSSEVFEEAAQEQLPPELQEAEDERIKRIDSQFQFAETLFISRTRRIALFTSRGYLEDHLTTHLLHPALVYKICDKGYDKPISISDLLVILRDAMEGAYREAEADIHSLPMNRGKAAPDSLYKLFSWAFWTARMCVVQFDDWNVRVRPLSNEYYALKRAGKIGGVLQMLGAFKGSGQKKKNGDGDGNPEDASTRPTPAAAKKTRGRGPRVQRVVQSIAGPSNSAVASKRTTDVASRKKRKRVVVVDEADVEEALKTPRKAARKRKEEGSAHDAIPAKATRRSTRITATAATAAGPRKKAPIVTRTPVEPKTSGRTLRTRKPTQAATKSTIAELAGAPPRSRRR